MGFFLASHKFFRNISSVHGLMSFLVKDAVTELTLFEGHIVGKLAQFEMSTMSIYNNVRSSGFFFA